MFLFQGWKKIGDIYMQWVGLLIRGLHILNTMINLTQMIMFFQLFCQNHIKGSQF